MALGILLLKIEKSDNLKSHSFVDKVGFLFQPTWVIGEAGLCIPPPLFFRRYKISYLREGRKGTKRVIGCEKALAHAHCEASSALSTARLRDAGVAKRMFETERWV